MTKLLILILITTSAYALTPAQTAVMRNWLDPNGVGDFTGDGVCNFADFALAAGRKRDFMNKAVIWGKHTQFKSTTLLMFPEGNILMEATHPTLAPDPNDQTVARRIFLQNFAVYIAESNSITKVDRKQRTIELQALYGKLWMEWN